MTLNADDNRYMTESRLCRICARYNVSVSFSCSYDISWLHLRVLNCKQCKLNLMKQKSGVLHLMKYFKQNLRVQSNVLFVIKELTNLI